MKWRMKQREAIYQGQRVTFGEKQALEDLAKLIHEPIPVISIIDTFKFGFVPKQGKVAKLGIPSKGLISLPDSIGNLVSLQELVLFGNQLKTLPESFSELKSLKFLNLVRNKLIALPASFGDLHSLQILYLNTNTLKALPDSFGKLKSLQRLNIRNNHLRTLPESFLKLSNLGLLWIEDNPLDVGAKQILEELKKQGVIIDEVL